LFGAGRSSLAVFLPDGAARVLWAAMFPELGEVELLLLYTGGVFAVMFVFLALLGRRLGSRRASATRAVFAVTGQHRLHVVEVDGRRLLVGTGPSGPPSLVCELGDEPAWARGEATAEGEWSRTRVLPHGGRLFSGDVPSVHGR